ncbi:virulence factor TspB C-terminal domain-related protein [Pseudomonas sp. WS 5011]|uniref:virulence factor TspB C-terminal domain-related protein n=1 Tax=Pseudomonas sp. WS 5011 TaxID=2717477 RepID=UPI001473C60B|nr:virulence factor TspB C-terminal domain-related protein [Pseudomonas sp. WS 5011]NMY53445.1 hypothetical protein [Pseudomonas sp. WS 5011]
MACFLRYCVFGLLSLSVLTAEAARQKPVVRPASAQDTFVKGGTTLDIDRHWGEILDVPGGRVNLPVTQKSAYSFSRIGGMIKQALNSNPVKYGATAAVTYLITQLPGASFDPLTGQLLKSPSIVTSVVFWDRESIAGSDKFSTGLAACNTYWSNGAGLASGQTFDHVQTSPSEWACRANNPFHFFGYVRSYTVNCPNGYDSATSACRPSAPIPSPFTPLDMDQLVSASPGISAPQWSELGPELLADIPATFDGPDSTAFDGPASVTGTPTITTTLDHVSGTSTVVESTPVHNFDFSTNPLSITTTTTTTNNTYQNGTLVSTTTQTQGQPSTEVSEVPAQLEIPTDCDFMPTVCSFIDWVKTPFNEEEPDLSELIADEDFEKEINFSSNATCPGPSMISTSHGDFEFSWEPGCQWAGMIKPLIIIAALVAAIFINLGTARGPE